MPSDIYSTARTFSSIAGIRVLSVKVNGGSLLVECQHGPTEWVTMKTYTADAAEVIDFGSSRVYRFTPSGGATYAL